LQQPELAGLKVCFLAGTLGQGGAECQLGYMVEALVQAGANVRVLSLTQGEFWESRLRSLGASVTWVGQSPLRPMRLLRILWDLARNRPHIVQSAHFYTNIYAASAARMLGIAHIGAIRNDLVSEVQANGAFLGRLSFTLPQMLAANSTQAMRAAAERGRRNRIILLNNAVDTARFRPPAARATAPVLILGAGRMVEQKRFDRFLQVIAAVRARSAQKIRAVLAGDGPLRSALEAQAAGLGLTGEVEFVGVQASLTELYRQAHILLLTSDHEGTPNVILEAMASGLAVVATRVGDVPSIIEDGRTGFTADPGQTTALAEAILHLVQDEDCRREIGLRAQQFVEIHHSVNALPRALQALYGHAIHPSDSRFPNLPKLSQNIAAEQKRTGQDGALPNSNR
jgi:glycosyltransferase involved in cell wall biosynthesis